MTQIVLFNAPPNSGKDFICEGLAKYYGANHCMFKKELYKETAVYFGMDTRAFTNIATDRKLKQKSFNCLGGRSPRQAMIHVSEDVIKPKYGRDYFGKLAAKQVVPNTMNVFSDSGFLDEATGLLKAVDTTDVLIVQMHRDGCSFDGDSIR